MNNAARRRRFAYKKSGMGATPAELDMTYSFLTPHGRPMSTRSDERKRAEGLLPLDPNRASNDEQIRARARRRGTMPRAEMDLLYKPIDEWDDEELARGRPRDRRGKFSGKTPEWVSKAYHEEIMRRFEKLVKTEVNVHTIKALAVAENILNNDKVDRKGRPMVPYAVKLDAVKFLIEHTLGKPVKRVESEVSVTLQGILAHAMVNPNITNFDEYQLTQGYIDADVVDDSMGRRNDGR